MTTAISPDYFPLSFQVGDCYVAVTGLPKARKDHALAMARFSVEVLLKFNRVIHNLAESLGDGTNQLGLRVGIHSGPCTAGVIRGDNARFQVCVCVIMEGPADVHIS